MRTSLLLLFLLASASLCTAEITRREITPATTAPDDLEPNSDQVPDVYALDGQFERIVVLRFKFNADLLPTLQRVVKEQGIRNAAILSGMGSVRGYHYHVVGNRTFPVKNIYVQDPEAPADITTVTGYVIDGRVHAHITLSDPDRAFGGHLEPGTRAFTFAMVTLGVFKHGIDLRRIDDMSFR